jgi:ankyrin repeat protein
MNAAIAGQVLSVQQLLLASADKNMCDEEGNTAAVLARQAGHEKIAAMLESTV